MTFCKLTLPSRSIKNSPGSKLNEKMGVLLLPEQARLWPGTLASNILAAEHHQGLMLHLLCKPVVVLIVQRCQRAAGLSLLTRAIVPPRFIAGVQVL